MNIESKKPWRGQVRKVMKTEEQLESQLSDYYLARQKESNQAGIIAGICFLLMAILFLIFLFAPMAHAQVMQPARENWTDKQIVSAIYLAEGGSRAKYPYGIRSVKCETKKECKKICENTVRNNRHRYNHVEKSSDRNVKGDFLSFLGRHYAPVGAKNDPSGFNRNWLKNVMFFLRRDA